jgi:putative nucleotidyltransferase with HDIG domain
MCELTLERIRQKVQQLPSLSLVLMEVLHSFDNEEVDVATLVGKISRDQGLTARILRVANSPFYGLPSRVSSIGEAVVVLGFNNIRSLAVAAGIINQFPPAEGKVFDRTQFWRHSIGTGVCAKVLAARFGKDQEEAFTAGLLHDIGVLVLDAYFHQDFERVLAYGVAEDCFFTQAESAVLGLSHGAIGFEVARQWKFPPAIQCAIRDHHLPDSGTPASLTDMVHLANVLCHALEIGRVSSDLVPSLSEGAWQRLGLVWGGMGSIFRDIERLNASVNLLMAE